MKKWILLAMIYIGFILIGFENKSFFLDWIHNSTPSQIPLMFLISTVLSIFPIIPFTLFAGVMGVKFGIFLGMAINWSGGVLAAILFFLFSRYSFQGKFTEKVKHYKKIDALNYMIEKNAFIAVLLTRLITIVPPIIVNVYSGLSRMSFKTYLIATGLGKIPSMFFFAYSGKQLFQSFEMFFIGLAVYLLFILVTLIVYKRWYKAKNKVIVE